MPKVKVIFNLPEEQEEYQSYMEGPGARRALYDIYMEIFRPFLKYDDFRSPRLQKHITPENIDKMQDFVEDLRAEVSEILERYDVTLD
jgi:hypothetical protein